ncbi:hypothetical protein [Leptolyngbya sp. FACHB-16]|uniref:hypothetical protein n=1 Tax=unclassified Leptolyngbya TaxID=2650499 RepID=UPI0016871604|nr:hypothetical protein [Leptolyngbya sp. FACHB-16]MBD2157403.1 hypothetical protein [Leptolyngbya sp. FACHB-16]
MKLKRMTEIFINTCRTFIAVVLAVALVVGAPLKAMALPSTSDAPGTGELAKDRLKEQVEGVFGDQPNQRIPGRVNGDYGHDEPGLTELPRGVDRTANQAQRSQDEAGRQFNRAKTAVESKADDARSNVGGFADSVKDSVRDLFE